MIDAPARGAALAVAGAGAFAGMSALVKYAGQSLPIEEVVFCRNIFALAALAPWLAYSHRRGAFDLATSRLGLHIIRASLGLTAMYCFFLALSTLPLASAVLLNYSQPLFLPVIAWLWLGERPEARIVPAVTLGFIGVALILKPGLGWVGGAGFVGLAAGLLSAMAMAAVRRLSSTEPALRVVAYFTLIGSLVSAIPAAVVWQAPDGAQLAALVGAGVMAVLGQLLVTRAFGLAPAARIGALIYTSVIVAALIGWVFWGEAPDLLSALGAAVVIVAALIVVFARAPRRSIQHR